MLIRHRLVIAVAAICGLVLGVGVSLLTSTDQSEPQASSSASVRAVLLSDIGLQELQGRLSSLTDGVVIAAAAGRPPSRGALYAELMTSPSILNPLANDLGLELDELRDDLTVTAEAGGLITISVRGDDMDLAQRAVLALVQTTNARLAEVDGPAFTVRLFGSPVVSRAPSAALSGDIRATATSRIAQELIAEDAQLHTTSALTLSQQLTPEVIEDVSSVLDGAFDGTALAERLTWGGAADPAATSDPAPGTEVTLTVVATDDDSALRAANATLDALDEAITLPGTDVSPLVRIGATATTTEAVAPRQDRTLTNAILGVLIGLAAGIGYAFLRESRDPRIRSGRQLAAFMSMPPIGLITDPPTSSAFQTLRSNVLFGHSDVRTLAVTSPSPGDGKWQIARGLAATLTQTDRTVVLVDTDMRRTQATGTAEAAATGLAELLEGRADLAQALQSTEQDGISFLPPGNAAVDPGDLLSRPRFTDVLTQLGAQFDYVLCVTAPLTAGSDAAIVSHCTSAALVLIRAGSTTTTALDDAANRLMQVDAKVLGIVVTGVADADVSQWSVQYFQPSPN